MNHYRATTSLISQTLCFCLLLQSSGIAQALPLPPKKTFVSKSALEAARHVNSVPDSKPAGGDSSRLGSIERFLDEAWTSAGDAGDAMARWEPPIRVVQTGGILPLPSRLISAFLGSTSQGHAGPPNPAGLGTDPVEPALPEELADLLEKAGTEEIPLLAGFNLISIPEEPTNPDPAAVFSAITGQFQKASAFDACDLADPWKLYDPGDPAASDLTVVNHKIGMWVKATTATILPSDGTLPATTTIELCEGWNLIGFPAGQPRHPHAALSSIAGKWLRIFSYDAFDSQDPWEFFDPNVPDWANDLRLMHPGRGYWVLASEATTLEIRNEGPPPTVAIASPADLAVITQPTEILGTVESDRLDNWILTSRAIGNGDAVTLATGNAPVEDGTLATFDPTLLLNGLYELELTATDVQGQQVTESIAVAVDGQMKIGHFTLSFVDLAVPVSGLDIEIIRTYDSRDKQQRDFGIGWSLDIRQGSYRNNRAPGDGWQLQTGFVACDTALESKSHLTVVRLSDQEVYRFALRLVRGAPRNGGGCSATAEFVYVDGPIPGASLAILGNDQVFQETPSSNRVLDPDTFATYEPQQVRLTTRDGRIFEIDLNNGVTLLEDLNGNQLSITPAGITHSSGKGIVFERDTEGRITHITDPMERVMIYGCDTAGDLVSFTDRGGATTLYAYDGSHFLLDIEDSRGVQPLRNEYDSKGRLVRHIDAFGKVTEFSHDLANRREIVTNRMGASRVLEYDARGNVLRETDELGNTTARVFDGRDNLLSQTDPLGRTTTNSYTVDGDLETLTDPLGNVTRYTYNSRSQPLTSTDPRGGVTTSVYDSRGNLSQNTDALGQVSSFTYDADGNPLTITDPLGQVTGFEYDSFGNQTKEIDALGNQAISTFDGAGNRLTETRTRTLGDGSTETLVTSFTHNALDRLMTTTAADGSSTSMTYDLLGNITSRVDQLGRSTTRTYDLMGLLATVSYPDGTTESRSYDDEGRLVTTVDRAGRTATFIYDPAGQQLSTTYPDGTSISRAYDDGGQLVTATDARGYASSFAYDEAGRRTGIIDALGNTTSFSYDKTGNRTAVTDPKGQTTTFTYDALDQLTTTTYSDGTTMQTTYDGLGRRLAQTDQAGGTTEFGYDPVGRLVSVKDALDQVTGYTYDEVGNLLAQTDANGNTTIFEYDRLGRRIARILPTESRESKVYNADGTLASHTDFNGAMRTFQYDASQRLIRRAYPDGSEITFTYTASGQRATVTDARGTTVYSYDTRDRLTEKIDPTGHMLSYAYDPDGNGTSLTATTGATIYTTDYTYDAANRLVAVTDSQGGVTNLGYDANGNRVSLAFPNSVSTTYAYDALNRLTDLSTVDADSDVLQSYAYTLDAAGHRSRVDEHDGTTVVYGYDSLYRLASEEVMDGGTSLVYRNTFSYDPAGNRLEQASTASDGTVTELASAYDDRNRLLSTGGEAYGWDANGNLVSRGLDVLAWDFENRLIEVTLEDGRIVRHLYDPDGARVRTETTDPATGETAIVNYLVDPSGPLSRVVAETDGETGLLLARHVWGNDLLATIRSGDRFLHADGLGSIRALTDETGAVTDRYHFEASGALLEHASNDSNAYLFAGEPLDRNIGFAYHRARWMDPQSGRFASMDPFMGSLARPLTRSPYPYANLDPVNNLDPSGRFVSLSDTLAATKIAPELAAIALLAAVTVVCSATLALSSAGVKAFPCGRDRRGKRDPPRFFYRGGGLYDASDVVAHGLIDIARIMFWQDRYNTAYRGFFITSQRWNAEYWANLSYKQGQAGGPATLVIKVPTRRFATFATAHGIAVEAPMPGPPLPGMTETIIPFSALPEFSSFARFSIWEER